MQEKLAFAEKFKTRLPQIEKETLYQKLLEEITENVRLSEIFNHLEEGVILVSENGLIHFSNKQADLWFDLSKQNKKKAPVWELISDSRMSYFLKNHLQKVKVLTVQDFKLLTPREIHLRLTLIPLEADPQNTTAILLSNISDMKEKDLETSRTSRMESLIQLAGGIAHEIGNPLNAIVIYLELLRKQLAGIEASKQGEIIKSLDMIQEETKRLDRIIKNFLKATRKPPLRFRMENLKEVVSDALAFLKPQLQENKIRTQFNPDKNEPIFLMDRERLYYAFMNLIKNAMEAMPQGGFLKISVSHKNHCAAVAIEDEGIGIEEENLPRIFDAYYSTKKDGAGLGLMMVYDAVSDHGGRIEVSSQIQKGTLLKILLPMRRPQLQLPNYSPPIHLKTK